VLLVVGSILLLASLVIHISTLSSIFDLIVSFACIGAMSFGILRYRPKPAWPFWCASGALAIFLLEGILRTHYHTLGNLTTTRSLLPDFVTLPGYLLLFVGLTAVVKHRNRGITHGIDALLNGLMAGLAILATSWIFLLGPIVASHAPPLSVKLVLVSYPPLSTFAVVLAIRIAATSGETNPQAYWYLLIAMMSMLFGDILYFFADADLFHVSQEWLFLPYGLAFLFAGACGLHPSMRELIRPATNTQLRYGTGQIVLMATSLLVPTLLLFGHGDTMTSDRVVLFVVDIALVGVVTARIVLAIRGEHHSRDELERLALQDPLTALPNRRQVFTYLRTLLERQDDVTGHHVSLIFIDLDQFKMVNDSYGHAYGDRLLQEVAARLERVARPSHLVGRIGGDEFVIVMEGVRSVDETTALAAEVRECLRQPYEIYGVEIFLSGSIGVSITPSFSNNSADILLRDADLAMYEAKSQGRDAVMVFDTAMSTSTSERLELRNDLRQAIALNELSLVYQPIVGAPDSRVRGVEALLRWKHGRLGQVSPALFIPVAEESGYIKEIGRWVLIEAIRQVSEWSRRSVIDDDFTVAVNLSALQLTDASLVEYVIETLRYYDVPTSRLCLELTESTLMDNFDAAVALLNRLRAYGIKIAIDDFGSGYSSLAYLSRLPVDQLKIDKAFIDPLMGEDTPDETLVAAIVAMGESLGVETIAEGIEHVIQATKVRSLGVTLLQGYLYSRPVAARQLPEVVERLNGPSSVEVLGA
jgi:diguanylate cyclase (GGDEF)-like protein